MRRQRLLTLLLVAVSSCAGREAGSPAPPPRDVVLVVLDSVRADRLGVLGYERAITPRLDALAHEGVLFERAYAASSAREQSLSALWTGRLPSRGGSTGLEEARPHPDLRTIPRLFRAAGFRTALASNVTALRERTFTRGFDDVEIDSVPQRWRGEEVVSRALELSAVAEGSPLLLVVALDDASEPHVPTLEERLAIDVPLPEAALSLDSLRAAAGALPPDVRERPGFLDLVARYDAEVARVDACLGKLVDGLAELGRLDDALLVVTSTHGVELLEHGYVGHGWTLFDEVLRVPLVVRGRGLAGGARVTEPVSLVDLVPTLAALHGLAPGAALDGEPLLEARAAGLTPRPGHGDVLAELVVPELVILRACVHEGWKAIEVVREVPPADRLALGRARGALVAAIRQGEAPPPDVWGQPVRRALYRLDEDPAEARDLATREPERLAALAAVLRRYAATCRSDGLAAREAAPPAAEAAPEDLEALRSLGYL